MIGDHVLLDPVVAFLLDLAPPDLAAHGGRELDLDLVERQGRHDVRKVLAEGILEYGTVRKNRRQRHSFGPADGTAAFLAFHEGLFGDAEDHGHLVLCKAVLGPDELELAVDDADEFFLGHLYVSPFLIASAFCCNFTLLRQIFKEECGLIHAILPLSEVLPVLYFVYS